MTERDPNRPIGDQSSALPPNHVAATDDATVAWTPPPSTVVEELSADRPAAEPVHARRGNGVRWAVALVVTVLVVGLAGAAAFLLTGQKASSALVGHVPGNPVAYGELRLDLPGDQRQKLGQFLSKFPGFQDQANLDAKVAEVLDRIVRGMSEDNQDYSTKIKPWFDGQLGFGIDGISAPTDGSMAEPRFVLLAGVRDESKARAWFEQLTGDLPTTTADHAGTPLTLFGEGSTKGAFGVVGGKLMVVGDEASVNAAIDTKGGGSFAGDARYRQAVASVPGDGLGFLYVDMPRYIDMVAQLGAAVPGSSMPPMFNDAYRKLVPEWMMLRLHARGDAIGFDAATPHLASTVQRSNRSGALAAHVPASTIALLDAHEYGPALLETLDLYRKDPALAEGFKQVDTAMSLLGGFDGVFGWMKDVGIAVTRDGDHVDGGLVIAPSDRAAAERLLSTLRGFISLGGSSTGLNIQVRDEPYAGTTISVIDFGDWRDLAALAGGGTGSSVPFTGHLEIAYAATDDIVVLGLGDSFVKAALDSKPGSSLADSARYKALLDRVAPKNIGSSYLDIAGLREIVEKLGDQVPGGLAEYERDVKPYLLPLDAWISSTTVDGQLDRSTGLVVVK